MCLSSPTRRGDQAHIKVKRKCEFPNEWTSSCATTKNGRPLSRDNKKLKKGKL